MGRSEAMRVLMWSCEIKGAKVEWNGLRLRLRPNRIFVGQIKVAMLEWVEVEVALDSHFC